MTSQLPTIPVLPGVDASALALEAAGAQVTVPHLAWETLEFSEIVEIKDANATTTPTPPPDGTVYFRLAELPSLAARLNSVTFCVVEAVHISVFPQKADVDLAFRIVPYEWAGLNSSRTYNTISVLDSLSRVTWRAQVTIPLASDIELPWPRDAISASLKGVLPGTYIPALMVSHRTSGSVSLSGPLRFRITVRVKVSGRGLFLYPS